MKKFAILILGVILFGLESCHYYGPCIDGVGPTISEVRSLSGFSSISNAGSFDVYLTQADSFYVEVRGQGNLLPHVKTYISGSTLIVETQNSACLRNSIPISIFVSLPEINVLSLSGSGLVSSEKLEDNLLEVVLAGSGQIMIDSLYGGKIILGNSASGGITTGYIDAGSVQAYMSGSGTIDAGKVVSSAEIGINHSSSGSFYMNVEDGINVNASLSGSGRVILYGEVEETSFMNSGSGRIDALEMISGTCVASNSGSGEIFVNVVDYLQATIMGSGDIIYRGDPEISYKITGSGKLRKY